jgi:prepilin-type processing-associated H-X9-DG protein
MFLTGDHNLGSDGTIRPQKGFVTAPSTYSPDFKVSLGTNFTANAGVGWLDTMHSSQGNVGLADGSVQQFSRTRLQEALRNSGDNGGATTPKFALPQGCSGQDVNRIQFP